MKKQHKTDLAANFRQIEKSTDTAVLHPLRASALAIALLFAGQQALAASVSVTPGGNLNGLPSADGDVWNLQGNATLYGSGSQTENTIADNATLTINGAAGGSTINLNDGGGHYGHFAGNTLTVNLTNNVTFTGGDNASIYEGGVFHTTSNLTLNSSGIMTLSGNTASDSGLGGAISSNGNVTLNGQMTLQDNHALGGGGAIYAMGNVTLNTRGESSFSNNLSGGNSGGAINSLGDITLNADGNLSFSNNRTGGLGGAIYADKNLALSATGGDITFSGNSQYADSQANAIYLSNNAGSVVATFNTNAGRRITFFDPISSGACESGTSSCDDGDSRVTVIKSGDGLLSFDGSLYSDTVELWSTIYGITNVQGGTFEVANNAVYGMQAADIAQTAPTSFNMGDNTTLQGGVMGTIRADAVSFGDDVTLNIAGRQPNARGIFVIESPSLTLGNNDRILFNTYLNDGVVQDTDLLRLSGTVVSGNAALYVTNTGGPGALTTGNGIMLVNVTDGGSTAADTFKLGNRVVAGAYEYDLHQGGVDSDADDGNWYLRSLLLPPSNNNGGTATPALRPETGVYLRNLTAGSTMFMHTLHDRLGEPQYTDAYKGGTDGKVSSLWLRVVGNHSEGDTANGQVSTQTDTSLVHLGGDLARWSTDGNDRWQVGLMGAYGQSDTNADAIQIKRTSDGILRTANGKVDGYSVGAYATWYGNKDKPTGAYIDTWAQYGIYSNSVQGNTLKEEKYDSRGWTASVEGGYAFIGHDGEKRQLIIEPQAQLAYNSYSADDHQEANGTWVRNGDSNGVIARLGARLYSRSKQGENGIQPFVETNWWYNSAKNGLTFDGQHINDGTPNNTFELKAGLQGEVAKGWQVWGHIGGRWGESNYSSYEGMVGVKHQF